MNSTDFNHKAKELISVKFKIEALLALETNIKKQLIPYISNEDQFDFGTGLLYTYSQKRVKSFNRKNVLAFIKEHYGDEVADKVDAHCTIKKVTPERLHVKLCKEKNS
jgi:hypothetical protein